jgi:hypothetical protein
VPVTLQHSLCDLLNTNNAISALSWPHNNDEAIAPKLLGDFHDQALAWH